MYESYGSLDWARTEFVVTTGSHGAERNKALGVWAAVGGAGSAVGVLLGGALTDGPGWQWVFYVNVPVGVLALMDLRRLTRRPVVASVFLLLIATVLLIAFFFLGSVYGSRTTAVGGMLIAAAGTTVTHEEAGLASGVVNTFHEVGDSIGVAVLSAVAAMQRADRRLSVQREQLKLEWRGGQASTGVPGSPAGGAASATAGAGSAPAGESQGVDRSPGRRLSWRSAYWPLPRASGWVRSCSPTGGGPAGWRAWSWQCPGGDHRSHHPHRPGPLRRPPRQGIQGASKGATEDG